ncbi:DUF6118 family protein [Cognatishimia sp. D5M38]|uniref:DUF6118 family protein n=1 Tax=Cognatishimia coralii TaxID=3083254 RepID=A0ABU8QKW1_9RHOB
MNDPFERSEDREAQARAMMQELRTELALQRRALELVVERVSDIPEPIDYSHDIGGLSKLTTKLVDSLAVIKDSPAMAEDGTKTADRIDRALTKALSTMSARHSGVVDDLRETRRWLTEALEKDRRADQQKQQLKKWTGIGVGLGVLLTVGLLAILPPSIAVAPYNMVREQKLWDIGWGLMRAGEPKHAEDLLSAWVIWKDNSDTIAHCQKFARERNVNAKCEIIIEK